MEPIVRVGVRTNTHTPAAVGSSGAPKGKTSFLVNLPSLNAIKVFWFVKGNGIAGAGFSTFFALLAEVDGGIAVHGLIRNNWQVGSNDRNSYPGAQFWSH